MSLVFILVVIISNLTGAPTGTITGVAHTVPECQQMALQALAKEGDKLPADTHTAVYCLTLPGPKGVEAEKHGPTTSL